MHRTDKRVGQGCPPRQPRGAGAVPRRADRHAGGRRLHPRARQGLQRLLWRFQHGAPADRDRTNRNHPQVQTHRQQAEGESVMTGAQFGQFVLALIGVAVVVAIVVWLLNWLYLRSSKERAFVRTGLGGQKVVLNGGALVLPIIHEVIPVNMNTLRLEVTRGRERALITKDRMRVDVTSEFYVRVQADADAIAAAAQTLGQRTMQQDLLKELVEGKFVDALRTVAAEMTMEEM